MRSRRLFPHQIQPLLHRLMIRPARRPQKRPEFGFTRSHILVPAVPFGDCQSRPRNHRGRRSQRFQALRRTLILLQQRHSRYVGSASRAGLQLQCAPGRFLRLQWLTQEQLCQPEIGMYGGAIGVDPERLPKGVRGLRVLAERQAAGSQVVPGFKPIWIGGQGLLEPLGGSGQICHVPPGNRTRAAGAARPSPVCEPSVIC